MNIIKKYKNIAHIVFAISLIILVVSSAWLKNISTQYEIQFTLLYIFILFILIASIVLYLLINKLGSNEIKNLYLNELHSEEQKDSKEEKTETVEEIEEKEEEITFEEFEEDILPKTSFKFLDSFATKLLINFGKKLEVVQGIFYLYDDKNKNYKYIAKYATTNKSPDTIDPGDGLTGQVANDKKPMVIENIPASYIIESGLGSATPAQLIILPILKDKKVVAIIELATFKKINTNVLNLLNKLSEKLSTYLGNFNQR